MSSICDIHDSFSLNLKMSDFVSSNFKQIILKLKVTLQPVWVHTEVLFWKFERRNPPAFNAVQLISQFHN